MGCNSNEAYDIWMIILLKNSTFLQELPLYVITQRISTRFDGNLFTSHFKCTAKHFTKLTLKAAGSTFDVILRVQVPAEKQNLRI
jgi:hypothetical protein